MTRVPDATDLLGRPLSAMEGDVLDIYARLKSLALREEGPPCVQANARFALAVVWQMVNDLNLEFEELDSLGV